MTCLSTIYQSVQENKDLMFIKEMDIEDGQTIVINISGVIHGFALNFACILHSIVIRFAFICNVNTVKFAVIWHGIEIAGICHGIPVKTCYTIVIQCIA